MFWTDYINEWKYDQTSALGILYFEIHDLMQNGRISDFFSFRNAYKNILTFSLSLSVYISVIKWQFMKKIMSWIWIRTWHVNWISIFSNRTGLRLKYVWTCLTVMVRHFSPFVNGLFSSLKNCYLYIKYLLCIQEKGII